MNKQEQDAFIHAFITTIGGVDEDAVAAWVRGEPVDLPYKHIEILQDAKEFWTKAKNFEYSKTHDGEEKMYIQQENIASDNAKFFADHIAEMIEREMIERLQEALNNYGE
ncbi:hypothetical protein N9045_01190 [bacterium]|nr:hypothetical protein [bacterium]